MATLASFITDLARTAKMDDNIVKESEKRLMTNSPSRVLVSEGYDFALCDICVRHEDLVSLIIKPNISSAETNEQLEKNSKIDITDHAFKNEFEELLASILRSKPRSQAKEIHRILCDECNREEDARVFDKNNILKGEDQGLISWRDKYRNNSERSYSQNSLKNVVSAVKKKMSLSASV
ncbi:hypothetical protein [Arsukibacterium perlucidum]|uniref:hypothetical protein n=1 Tax=Arsukibacterium perlucidum TaxID=368811 RepID=UPI0003760340|nr:hypothetical protein [Arsukibacterium perlucidum]